MRLKEATIFVIAFVGVTIIQSFGKLPDHRNIRNVQTNSTHAKGLISSKYAMNYADRCCKQSQLKNCKTALEVGGFDECMAFSATHLDKGNL
jgi:hypothetical protein